MIARRLKALVIKPEFLVIGGVILFTLLLSITVFMQKSLRLDEAQSLWQTDHSFLGTIYIVAQDVHVPLYFIGLRSWELAFGISVAAIRSFSLLFLLISIPLLYSLAKEIYGRRVALATVLLAGASPFLHWFGSEARMYSLLLCITIINQLFFMRLWHGSVRPSRLTWLGYGISAMFGVLTHYFFAFVLAVQALFYISHRPLFTHGSFKRFVIVAVISVAELVGWLGYRTITGTVHSSPLLVRPSSVDIFNVFSNFFIGAQNSIVNAAFLSLWPLIVFAAFALLARRQRILPETTYLLMAAAVPILLAFLVSTFIRPLFVARYLIICLPPLYILTTYYISLYSSKTSRILFAGVILIMGAALWAQAFSPSVLTNENYREASEYVEANAHGDDLFVVTAPFTTYPVEYYYKGPARLTTFPEWNRYQDIGHIPDFSLEYLESTSASWSKEYEYVYVLMSYDQGYEEKTRIYLDTHYEKVQTKQFSPGMTLYVYKLRYL